MDNFGRVKRTYKINLEYFDVNGRKHQESFEGFEATVLSHEIDHLDGILHIDIADELSITPAEERKKIRQTRGYNIISKIGKFEDLLNKK